MDEMRTGEIITTLSNKVDSVLVKELSKRLVDDIKGIHSLRKTLEKVDSILTEAESFIECFFNDESQMKIASNNNGNIAQNLLRIEFKNYLECGLKIEEQNKPVIVPILKISVLLLSGSDVDVAQEFYRLVDNNSIGANKSDDQNRTAKFLLLLTSRMSWLKKELTPTKYLPVDDLKKYSGYVKACYYVPFSEQTESETIGSSVYTKSRTLKCSWDEVVKSCNDDKLENSSKRFCYYNHNHTPHINGILNNDDLLYEFIFHGYRRPNITIRDSKIRAKRIVIRNLIHELGYYRKYEKSARLYSVLDH